jgi:hypothetical protein
MLQTGRKCSVWSEIERSENERKSQIGRTIVDKQIDLGSNVPFKVGLQNDTRERRVFGMQCENDI